MTAQQQQALDIASRLGVEPAEVDLAIRLAQTGRVDLIVHVSAKRMSVRAALQRASNDRARRILRNGTMEK
jgi:hypothetical protein